ncbi:MAG: GNAT family N-acetyltransferase [Thermodesulfobacteriota bacterium]
MKTTKPRVLLINPCWTGISSQAQRQFRRVWQPLSLAVTAAMLDNAGAYVHIEDANATGAGPEKLAELARSADKVFITTTPYDRWQCPSLSLLFFFDALSGLPRDRLYIMGGHVTERPEALLAATGARAAVLAEPEQTVLDLALHDDTAAPRDSISRFPGTAYIFDDVFFRSDPRAFLFILDDLPFPDFSRLPMERYNYFPFMGKPFAILEASRGCPVSCSFCYLGMYGKKVRRKSLARFLAEVRHTAETYGVKNFYFMDLEFCLKPDFVAAFCEAILSDGPDIAWCCQTRVTDMTPDLARLMRRAGCTLIHFGVEAGADEILRGIGKGITPGDAIRAVRICRSQGIRTAAFFNFGFPDETPAQMEKTIELSTAMAPTFASFHLIVPFPGTRLIRELGVDPEEFPADAYPQYNFVHHDLHDLSAVLKRAYLRFYLRPGFVKNLLADSVRALKPPLPPAEKRSTVPTRHAWTAGPYAPGDEDKILDLRKRVWGAVDPVRNLAKTWRWQFAENPAGAPGIWLAREGEKVVGQYAAVPTRMSVDGQSDFFAFSCDTMTDPEFRGQSMFPQLARKVYDEFGEKRNIRLVWGFPNSSSMPGFVEKLSWTRIGTFPVFVCPLSLSCLKGKLGGEKTLPFSEKGLSVSSIVSFDDRFDALWAREKPGHGIIQTRDARYLSWRYHKVPEFGYQPFGVFRQGEKDLLAYFVLRPMRILGIPVAALLDFFPLPIPGLARTTRAALRLACRVAALSGAYAIVSLFPRPFLPHALSAGFLPVPRKLSPKSFDLAALFPDHVPASLRKPSAWHLMLGDTDIV